MTSNDTHAPLVRPYGLAGLFLSLFAIAAIGALILAAAGLALALADFLINGGDHVRVTVATLMGLPQAAADGALPGSWTMDRVMTLGYAASAIVYVAIILAIGAMAWLRGGRDWRDLIAWRPFRLDWTYCLIVILGIAYGIGASAVVGYLHPEAKDWFAFPKDPISLAISLVLVAVVGPIAEELLFRGWIYTSLRARWGFATTLIVTSALFALAHWERTHLYAAAVFPLGLLLGYVREKLGSTRATAGFHGLYNLSMWVLAAFAGM